MAAPAIPRSPAYSSNHDSTQEVKSVVCTASEASKLEDGSQKVGDDDTLAPRAAAFGDEDGELIYASMNWWQAGVVMIAETISLGILSLPRAIGTLGFVPGALLILLLGVAATYTGFVVYQFKIRFPKVNNYADAGQIVAGSVGRWIGEILSTLVLIFILAAHVVTFSVMMNTLTNHGSCTVVFTVVGTVISLVGTVPRTLKATSYISIGSCASICIAVIIAMIGIAIAKPAVGNTYIITPSTLTSLAAGAESVSGMVIAFTGHIAYFHIISEMKEPRDFPKALAMLNITAVTFYVVVAVVIYNFAGQAVASPALGSASPIVRKICYGIAMPTIVVAGVINANVCAKNIYKNYWETWKKQPCVISEKSFRARSSWLLILTVIWVLALIIGETIPVFHQLLGLIGAAFCTWFTLGFSAIFWLWMQWQVSEKGSYWMSLRHNLRAAYFQNWKKGCLSVINMCILCMSIAICILGLYGTGVSITRSGSTRAPFSCADNRS